MSAIFMLCLNSPMFAESLSQQLRDARRRTRLLTRDLEGAQLFGPKLPIVNPVLWELGHVAWFQERWCLRLRADESLSESLLESADALYDSATVEHDTRWDLPLPRLPATLEYQDRVLDGGYGAPRYWVERDGEWRERRFDKEVPLQGDLPVVHVNWHEANAYCRYAGRRLPSEAEWEMAASFSRESGKRRYPWGDTADDGVRANLNGSGRAAVGAFTAGDSSSGCRQMLGNVWEWISSPFDPYPGFVRDPYIEYSEPWFGTHKVLRGGSFATPARLISNTWRNFYTPDRGDIFAGFRTCAIE